jgi:DNA-directed RNA polymerase subunit RPC12/RpoP
VSVRVEATCPRAAESDERTTIEAETPSEVPGAYSCTTCGDPHELHRGAIAPNGGLAACVACGHRELYTQKDFPRGLGLAIVALAALLAPFTWYLSLVAAAVIDALLFKLARNVVVCYVCRSRHSRFADEPRHPRFDREIDERLKFGARAVMGKPMRSGGTANAPEPEH